MPCREAERADIARFVEEAVAAGELSCEEFLGELVRLKRLCKLAALPMSASAGWKVILETSCPCDQLTKKCLFALGHRHAMPDARECTHLSRTCAAATAPNDPRLLIFCWELNPPVKRASNGSHCHRRGLPGPVSVRGGRAGHRQDGDGARSHPAAAVANG